MKRKAISAVVYAVTAFALAEFFDSLYGAGPVTRHVGLIHLAICGTIAFLLACVLSLFAWRMGVFCGLAAAVLSWPCFAISVLAIPWGSLFSILPYSNWSYLLIAILTLVVATAYSVNQSRLLVGGGISLEERRTALKLVLAILYAVFVFVSTNWRDISDWLYKLRYGT